MPRRKNHRHIAQYGAHGAIQPNQVSGLFSWHKADSIEGLADGAEVASWSDSSGNGHTLTGSAFLQPLYKTGIQNGKPILRFDGINDQFTYTVAATSQPFTVFTVAKWGATTFGTVLDGDTINTLRLYRSDANTANMHAGGGIVLGGPQAVLEAFGIYALIFNGASSSGRINGGTGTSGNAGASAIAGIHVAAQGDGGGPFDGDLAELIIYNSALTLANMNIVGRYLAQKYAISWTTAA